MKLDCVNKLNSISRHSFRFLKYFDTCLSEKNLKVVKEKFHRISPPYETLKRNFWLSKAKNVVQSNTFSKVTVSRVINSTVLITQ